MIANILFSSSLILLLIVGLTTTSSTTTTTSSGNLNTSVGLLEVASGALNTSLGVAESDIVIVSGIAEAGGGGGATASQLTGVSGIADTASGISVFASGQTIILATSSGNLNTSVGLLEVASGDLNTRLHTVSGIAGAGGGGSSTFAGLSDTPANFSSAGSKFVRVNAAANALEFVADSGIAAFASGLSISSATASGALNTSVGLLETASGTLNTSVGLLETASGALNTSVGTNASNNTIVSGISVHSVSGSVTYDSTASGNISGINTVLLVDQAAYNSLDKDSNTLYLIPE